MDYLRQKARRKFLHGIEGTTSEYDVHEIRGSEGDIVYSKITKTGDQMQKYLLENSNEPVFKAVS